MPVPRELNTLFGAQFLTLWTARLGAALVAHVVYNLVGVALLF